MSVSRVTSGLVAALLTVWISAGCAADSPPPASSVLTLTSPDVSADGVVPEWAIGEFSGYCDGQNRSIGLRWSGVPQGTRSFVVLMVDGSYPHWVVTGIPATSTEIGAADDGQVTSGVVGRSLNGPSTYIGPCVTGHEYVYTVYALDIMLSGDAETTVDDARAQMDGHILGESSLVTKRV